MPGIFISLAISFLLFLYAPVDLYCANTAEFWFDFSTLLITALGMFAACFAVLAVLYLIAMLIHPYVYRIALAGGLTLFICTYIQGNFMIDKLPPLDGTTIKWENYTILRTEDPLECCFADRRSYVRFSEKRSVFQNRNVSERWTYPDAVDHGSQRSIYQRGIAGESALSAWRR